MDRVNRNGKQENNKNASFHQCFQRVKSISRPGRWIGAFVMQQVKNPEQLFMMHQPVRKIEIRIVHKKHDGKSKPEIKPAMLIDFPIKRSVPLNGRYKQQPENNACKNEHR